MTAETPGRDPVLDPTAIEIADASGIQAGSDDAHTDPDTPIDHSTREVSMPN